MYFKIFLFYVFTKKKLKEGHMLEDHKHQAIMVKKKLLLSVAKDAHLTVDLWLGLFVAAF